LKFSPTAWAKLLFFRDYGDTEVGGFGVSSDSNMLFVEDIRLVQQQCSWAHVAFDDNAVANFFDDMVDEEYRPEQFARIWIHTHPGDCPRPSMTDERTFERVFGRSDWAVMFILAKGGDCYMRLRSNAGPGIEVEGLAEVDFSRPFEGSAEQEWELDYLENVQVDRDQHSAGRRMFTTASDDELWDAWYEYAEMNYELDEEII
jgi:proteasome lid subunit RPN8/RPN11